MKGGVALVILCFTGVKLHLYNKRGFLTLLQMLNIFQVLN